MINILFSIFLSHAFASNAVIKSEMKEPTFKATVNDGFHFNDKAPNSLTIDGQVIKPSKLTSKEAEFNAVPAKWTKGKASLYICDDAVTFCEPHFIELGKKSEGAIEKPVSMKKRQSKINSHGFIEDDLNSAIDQAKKQKKLVLIDFSARWCPGCLRFENETFDTKEFKNLTKDFVKLKLDVDRFENIILSEKFKIKGIPTLLILNSEQEEISRMYDYQPNDILERFFSQVKSDPATIKELQTKAVAGDNALKLRLGQRLLTSGQAQEALAVLSKVQPTPPELLQAKVEAMEDLSKQDKVANKEKQIQVLREVIKAESNSSRSITWRTTLVTLVEDKEEIKRVTDEGVAVAETLLSDKEKLKEGVKKDLVGEFTGLEPLLVAMYKAELIESAARDAEQVSLAWKQAAETGKSLKIDPKKIGPALRYLIILIKAQVYEDADKLALSILKHDPNNGDVMRRRLRILVETKKFPEAIELGKRALKNSYDRNEFWVAESLAKAYIGAGKNKEAKDLLDKYLGKTESEWSNLQGSRKNMEEMRKKL